MQIVCLISDSVTKHLAEELNLPVRTVLNIEGVIAASDPNYNKNLYKNTKEARDARIKRVKDYAEDRKNRLEELEFAIPVYSVHKEYFNADYINQNGFTLVDNNNIELKMIDRIEFKKFLSLQDKEYQSVVETPKDAYTVALWSAMEEIYGADKEKARTIALDKLKRQKAQFYSKSEKNAERANTQQTTQFDVQQISNNTASFGVTIDSNLKQNWQSWQKENPNGIVAYRVNFRVYNTPEEANAGRIGNPFSEVDTKGLNTVTQFYNWLVNGNNYGNPKATKEYRQAIINKILNTPENAPILYYRELGHPSHATVIGYLVNNKNLLSQSQDNQPQNNIKNYTQIHKGNWSRKEAEQNPRVLYVFTDNTDRDSGSGRISDNSWYSKKYGKGHHFPTMTAAVVRGLDNARPISTQRWYHQGAKGVTGRWTDADVNEFKKTIREELQEIVNEFNTGKYDTIMFPSGDGLFNTSISNITKQRTPQLYQALGEILHEFGFDSLVPTDVQAASIEEQKKYEKAKETHEETLEVLGRGENAEAEVKDTMKSVVRGISFEEALGKVQSVFSEEEINQIKTALNGKKLHVMSVSRQTDPVFFTKEIISFLEKNAQKPLTDPTRINAIEIWSKHDGMPMQDLLRACKKYKVAPMVSFSITGLGDTALEKGVMKYNDLLDRIEQLIKVGDLNPTTTTVRIDPILVGVTNMEDIKAIVERAKGLGVKKFVTSLVQSYGYLDGTSNDRKVTSGINKALASEGKTYDWDKYYGRDYRGAINFKPKQQYIDAIGKVLLELNKDPEIEIQTCSFLIKGLKASACLDPLIIERITGVSVTRKDGTYDRDTSRPDCMCYGAHSDMFRKNQKQCFSSCAYCYAGKSDNPAITYYNEDGTFKDNKFVNTYDTPYTSSSNQETVTQPQTQFTNVLTQQQTPQTQQAQEEEYDNTPPETSDVLKQQVESPLSKLNKMLTAKQLSMRIDYVARRFSEYLDTIVEEFKEEYQQKLDEAKKAKDGDAIYEAKKMLKKLDSEEGRKLAIQLKGNQEIYDDLRAAVQDEIDDAENDYTREQYQILYDYYQHIFNLAAPIIENYEGVRFIFEDSFRITNKGKKKSVEMQTKDSQEQQDKENSEFEEEENKAVSGNEGWGFQIKFADPHTTTSKAVKKALFNLIECDSEGNYVTDDLGNIRYVSYAKAYAVLLDRISRRVTKVEDFVVKNEDGSMSYPLLENLADKYPWIKQLTEGELLDNERLGTQMFTSFYMTYVNYVMDKYNETIPLNKPIAVRETYNDVLSNYEHGNILTSLDLELNIYNSDSTVNRKNAKNLLKTIQSLREEVDDYIGEDIEENSDFSDFLESINNVFRALGFNTSISDLYSLYRESDDVMNFHRALDIAERICEEAQNLNEKDHLIEKLKRPYTDLSDKISLYSESSNIGNFRQNGNNYPSYSFPSYVDQVIGQLKSDDFKEFIDREYKSNEWFYNHDEAIDDWRNEWLKVIYNDEDVRNNMTVTQMNYIDDIPYNKWKPNQIRRSILKHYFEVYRKTSADRHYYADYNFPIFSDSEMMMFIKMPKYTGDFKNDLKPLYRKLVRQEIYRISHVMKRKAAGVAEIQNYDKNGKDFCFIPELNNYKDEIFGAQSTEEQNKIIDTAIESILTEQTKELYGKINAELADEIKQWTKVKSDDALFKKLEEYIWNSVFAESQINQLVVTDLALYKNEVDLQKRFKEVYASGRRLNTNSKYGKKSQYVIYLKDNIITSNALDGIEKSLDLAIKEGRLTPEEKYDILAKFQNINSTDGQAFRTLPSLRSILDMLGEWDEEKMNPILERFERGEWRKSDFDIVWNTIKPFYYSQVMVSDGLGGKMKVGVQLKDSEYLLLAAYNLVKQGVKEQTSSQMVGLNKFMLDYGIDAAIFESGVKAGAQGIIDINYSPTKLIQKLGEDNGHYDNLAQEVLGDEYEKSSDYEKFKAAIDRELSENWITQEEYNQHMKDITPTEQEVYQMLEDFTTNEKYMKSGDEMTDINGKTMNSTIVHELPMDGYMIAQPTPHHLFDTTSIFGSQFRNLSVSDMPDDIEIKVQGKIIKGRENVLKFYSELINEDLYEDFDNLRKTFGSIEKLQKVLKEVINGNPKYGADMLNAIELIDTPNGKQFNLPINNITTSEKLQEIVTSLFKNRITKQKFKGAACILVSNIGYTNDLKVIKGKNGEVKAFEVLMPWHSKKQLKPFLKQKTDENGKTYQTIDIDEVRKHDPKLLEGIGFRIPTENKYSIMSFRIKGFLPQVNGSVIMMPADTVVYAGEDFDVDKKFLLLYEYFKNKETNQIETYKYDHNKPVSENRREARHNMIIDVTRAIWSNVKMSDQVNHPGGYDNLKIASIISDITNDRNLLKTWAALHGIKTNDVNAISSQGTYNYNELYNSLMTASLAELSKFIKKYQTRRRPMGIETFIYNHQQNMAGGALIGIYANNSVNQAKLQTSRLSLKSPYNIDGREVKTLSNRTVKEKNKEKLISQYCSEYSAASVDNVKDPVLAKLMQNPDTAYITCYMLRLGMNPMQISLFFNLPLVRQSITSSGKIEKRDILSVVNELIRDYGIDKNYVKTGRAAINSKELFTINCQSLEEDNITDSDANVELVSKYCRYLYTFAEIMDEADKLRTIVQITRADSPNGAIETTIAGMICQIQKVNKFAHDCIQKNYPFTGAVSIINNESVANLPIEVIREVLNRKELPMLQAFYNLGIFNAKELLSNFFPQLDGFNMEGLDTIQEYLGGKIMSEDLIENFLKGSIWYQLSKNNEFGGKDYLKNRDYYIYQFPEKLYKILGERNKENSEYKEFNDLFIANKMRIVRGHITFERASRLTEDIIAMYMRDFDTMIQSDNKSIRTLAVDLFKYVYYRHGLSYSPNSYSNFFSTNFLLSMPAYVETLRQSNNKLDFNFIDQYCRNHLGYIAKSVPLTNDNVISSSVNNDGKIVLVLSDKAVKNSYAINRRKPPYYPYISCTSEVNGERVTKYFKIEETSNNASVSTPVYVEIEPNLNAANGIYTNSLYNASATAEELASYRTPESIVNKALSINNNAFAEGVAKNPKTISQQTVASVQKIQREERINNGESDDEIAEILQAANSEAEEILNAVQMSDNTPVSASETTDLSEFIEEGKKITNETKCSLKIKLK